MPGLWLRFPNSVTSPLFSNLYIWLKINECIEYKLLSLTYKAFTTAQPSYTYLYSLITVQPPRGTRFSSVVTLSRPPTCTSSSLKPPIAHFTSSLESIIFLSRSVSLAETIRLMMSHYLIYLPPAHHSYPPSHTHYFIPGSKLNFSTNRSHHSLLAPTWTAFSDYTGPDLLYSTVFHF